MNIFLKAKGLKWIHQWIVATQTMFILIMGEGGNMEGLIIC